MRPAKYSSNKNSQEYQQLADSKGYKANWKYWRPYLCENVWVTVREDYSPEGSVLEYFPHSSFFKYLYNDNGSGLEAIPKPAGLR
jgi:hypothetical protein